MKKTILLFLVAILAFSCQTRKNTLELRNESTLKISKFSIPLDNNALHIYEGFSNFIYTDDNEVLFIASNHYTDNLDIFSLVRNRYVKPIPIPKAGPNAFYGVNTIALFNNTIYIDDGPFLHTIDFSSLSYTKQKISDIIHFKSRNYFLTTSRFVANFDTGFRIDTVSGVMYLPLFPAMRKNNPDYWNGKILCRGMLPEYIFQPLDIDFPDYFREGSNYGELDRPQLLIKGDSLIYTFGCSPTIYIYNTHTKVLTQSTSLVNLGMKIIDPYAINNHTTFGNLMDHIDACGVYMPMKYSSWDKRFYRIRRLPKEKGSNESHNNPINILMVLDEDFNLLMQYKLPSNLLYNFLPTPKGLFFQEYVTEKLNEEFLHYVLIDIPIK